MLKRLIQWFKRFFQSLFGGNKAASPLLGKKVQKQPPPPLDDTDLEFLFTDLLEGVHLARGQTWALKWLHNIEHRVSTERWVSWLGSFGDRLRVSTAPNNELASRMVQLGELEVGEVGDTAYDIGMQLLTRNQGESTPVWEYDGPDGSEVESSSEEAYTSQSTEEEHPSEEGYQTVTVDQLFAMMQDDESLRQQIAQQLGIETDDPEVIVQLLVEQFQAANQPVAD
jgi:hypothetical protein